MFHRSRSDSVTEDNPTLNSSSATLTLVCGLPGSGKSFLARRLAQALNAEYISSDAVRMRVLEQRSYSAQERSDIYSLMLEMTRDALHEGRKVVADATFYRRALRDEFRAIAAGLNIPFKLIEVRAARATIERRLNRPRRTSEADLAVHDKIAAEFEAIEFDRLVLHSDDETRDDERLDAALRYLES